MPVTADKPSPYAPPTAVLEIIDRYRNRTMQIPVTAEVLGRAGVSDSLQARTLQALQTLDLIDETGKPTKTFETIRKCPEAEFKSNLATWLKATYADVFSYVDPSKDDETRIRDAFRSYQPIGQQPRMVTLFQGLCAAAGLAPDRALQPRPLTRPTTPSVPKRSGLRILPKPKSPSASAALPPALAGLIASLPSQEDGWTKGERDKFVAMFGSVLDFCFPIVTRGAGDKPEKPS